MLTIFGKKEGIFVAEIERKIYPIKKIILKQKEIQPVLKILVCEFWTICLQ